jgi:hypothetical protein
VVQLDPFGWYDEEFKTHIVIMGCYLVVLLAHHTVSEYSNTPLTGKYQTVYLVDWVRGHVIHVRTPSTTFESFFEFPMSPAEKRY